MANDINPFIKSLLQKKMINDSPESCFHERNAILYILNQILGQKMFDQEQDFMNCPLKYLEAIRGILKCFDIYDKYDGIILTQLQELQELRQFLTHLNIRFGMGQLFKEHKSVNVIHNSLAEYFSSLKTNRKKKKSKTVRHIQTSKKMPHAKRKMQEDVIQQLGKSEGQVSSKGQKQLFSEQLAEPGFCQPPPSDSGTLMNNINIPPHAGQGSLDTISPDSVIITGNMPVIDVSSTNFESPGSQSNAVSLEFVQPPFPSGNMPDVDISSTNFESPGSQSNAVSLEFVQPPSPSDNMPIVDVSSTNFESPGSQNNAVSLEFVQPLSPSDNMPIVDVSSTNFKSPGSQNNAVSLEFVEPPSPSDNMPVVDVSSTNFESPGSQKK